MISSRQRWSSRIGFVLGVILAAAVVMAGRVPAEGRPLDAHVKLSATATGGVSSLAEQRLVASGRLFPGSAPVEGRVRLLNQTSKDVNLLVRATSADPALDRIAAVELRVGSSRRMRTTLGALRRWRPVGGPVASQRTRPVAMRVWIPSSVSGGYEARRLDVTLEFTREGASL